jgi:Small Multidrug Resistance protein
VITIGTIIASFALLAQALKPTPVGTGYAVWTGVGAVGAAIVGILFSGPIVRSLRVLAYGRLRRNRPTQTSAPDPNSSTLLGSGVAPPAVC